MRISVLLLACAAVFGQTPEFEVATVKPARPGSRDSGITADPGRLAGRNVSLKDLIFEAYHVQYYQIVGGPAWLGSDVFDIEAKSDKPVDRDQLRLMLRALLSDRFRLAVHTEKRDLRVYTLKGGTKLHAAAEGEAAPEQKPGFWRYRRELPQFAGVLAVKLSIPMSNDPGSPSRATGPLVPVLDQTGLKGIYDIEVSLLPDPGADTFTTWQRALREQYGLRLESQKQTTEILVVDKAEKPSEITAPSR